MIPANLRPDLARHVHQRVHAFTEGFRHNLALIGPPGSGKTFQLQRVLEGQPSQLAIVYCSLYRESPRSFLRRFLCAILQAGVAPVTGARTDTPERSLEPAYDALLEQARGCVPRTAAAVRAVEPLLERRHYGEALSRALDVIPQLAEERHQPCVLILDEFLRLEDLGFVHAFHELGKRVMTWNSTLFILSSSSPHRARAILRERLQLLFGQFELLTLGPVDPHSAAVWVHQELKPLRGAKTVSPFLVRWLGAYPWYLALVLKRLKELAALRRAPELTEPLLLQTMWDLVGSSSGALHQWCVSRTEGLAHQRVGLRGMEALIQVATGARTTTEIGRRIGRGGLSAALQMLVEQDLAQRNGMCWMVTDPILRCWLSTIVCSQHADARVDSAALVRRFEAHLRALWTQWVQAHELSFPARVAELFSKFREDTVSLDAKTGRLPVFDAIRAHEPEPSRDGVYLVADGKGRRWCASVQDGPMDENAVARFDAFCGSQQPKPARKVVITTSRLEENARLLAKTANMWVWEPEDIDTLMELYGQL